VYGDPSGIRTYLESIGKQYVMAVSGKTYLWMGMRQIRVSEIMEHLPDNGWQRLSTGVGSKGEKSYDWLSLPLTCARKGFGNASRFGAVSLIRRNCGGICAVVRKTHRCQTWFE